MNHRIGIALILVLFVLAGWAGTAKADGIIIPDPPCPNYDCPPWQPTICPPGVVCPPQPPRPRPISQLQIKTHQVSVTINQQVAVTHVDQVFFNPNDWTVEGDYVFPLPVGATVSQFTLWVDGSAVEGKILDASEARKYYENIVRQQKDPALLEYAGQGAVQARIFPIPPNGERRIELEYTQVLSAENGLVRYVYPLNTEKFSTAPLESVSVSVSIHAAQPLRAIYSTSHPVSVTRNGDRDAVAGWEAKQVKPDQDFVLYYSVGESQALHVLTYRDPADPQDPDGFFLMLLAPKPELPDRVVAKDVILVLDHSGSMEGEKFTQAQAALKYILQHLNAEDRFGLVAFSTAVEPYARGLRPADEAAEAVAWVDRLSARGSTDINRALLEAASMVEQGRPTYIIFLTDGLPTVGVTQRDQILANFSDAAPSNARLFAFGVGNDVDTLLLDTLSQQQHGLSTYVRPGENLDEILSSFYERISTPVLTDLSVDFGGMSVYDLYPNPLPDLFSGSQVIVVGRYRQGGTADLQLTGKVNDQVQTFSFPSEIFAQDSRGADLDLAALPRLWATRKVGYLLNQIRLNGADQETIDQIVRLSIRYGIVTPYTSYLVTEPMPLGAENQQRVAQDAFRAAQAAPEVASGAGAVQKAADQGALTQAQQAPAMPQDADQRVVTVGARTFVFNQQIWTDTAYDPGTMQTIQIPFLSDAYFKLSENRVDVAATLALGQRVIVVIDGQAYEVMAADGSSTDATPVLPATLTPAPTQDSFQVTPQPINTTPVPVGPQAPSDLPQSQSWLPLAGAGLAFLSVLGIVMLIATRRKP